MRVKLKYNQYTLQCQQCKQSITMGTPMVNVCLMNRTGVSHYHLECFSEFLHDWFDTHEYVHAVGKTKYPPELRKERNRLISKKLYHRKKGHTEEVRLLEQEIKDMEW